MQMNNWLVSTALGFGLLGSTQALAATTITWADFSKTTPTQVGMCVSQPYSHTCGFCEANLFLYGQEAAAGRCSTTNSADNQSYSCWTCDKVVTTVNVRVPLPDGDLIDVTIERGATDPSGIVFRLESGPNVTWWKQVAFIGGGDYWSVWNENGSSWCNYPQASTPNCSANSEWTNIVLAPGSRFVFSKARGIFATRTDMYELFNLGERLIGGDRVTFRWIQDRN